MRSLQDVSAAAVKADSAPVHGAAFGSGSWSSTWQQHEAPVVGHRGEQAGALLGDRQLDLPTVRRGVAPGQETDLHEPIADPAGVRDVHAQGERDLTVVEAVAPAARVSTRSWGRVTLSPAWAIDSAVMAEKLRAARRATSTSSPRSVALPSSRSAH